MKRIIFLIAFLLSVILLGGNSSAWWDTSWNNRINFTIMNTVPEALTAIQLYVNFTAIDGIGNYSSFRVVDADEVELNISFDFNNSEQVGIWFADSLFELGENNYTMYFNNSNAQAVYNTTRAFGPNATFVWHLQNQTAEIGGNMTRLHNMSHPDQAEAYGQYPRLENSTGYFNGTGWYNASISAIRVEQYPKTIIVAARNYRQANTGTPLSIGRTVADIDQIFLSQDTNIYWSEEGAGFKTLARWYANVTYGIGIIYNYTDGILMALSHNQTLNTTYDSTTTGATNPYIWVGARAKTSDPVPLTGEVYEVQYYSTNFTNATTTQLLQNFNSSNRITYAIETYVPLLVNQTNPSLNRSIESAYITFKTTVDDSDSLTAFLHLNGTKYSTTKTTDGTIQYFEVRITTPVGVHLNDTAVTPLHYNATTFWNITHPDGTSSTTPEWNHSIYKPMLHDCASINTDYVLNVTVFDERTNAKLDVTLKEVFEIYVNNSNTTRTFNFTYNNVNFSDFCVHPSWMDLFHARVYIAYNATGYVNRTYENTLLAPLDLNNVTVTTLQLYLLAVTDFSDIILRVMDDDYNAVEGATILVERYYPEEDLYRDIETLTTDAFGRALGHLVENTVDYRFSITNSSGSLAKVTSRMKVICVETPCELEFVISAIDPYFDEYQDINLFTRDLVWDSTNRQFVATWNDLGAGTSIMRLTVLQLNGSGMPVICNVSSSALSGTLTCGIPTSVNGTFKASLWRGASPENPLEWLIETIGLAGRDIFGTSVMFWLMLIALAFLFIGAWSPKVSMMLCIMSFITFWIFGLMNIQMSFLWGLIIATLIIISRYKE